MSLQHTQTKTLESRGFTWGCTCTTWWTRWNEILSSPILHKYVGHPLKYERNVNRAHHQRGLLWALILFLDILTHAFLCPLSSSTVAGRIDSDPYASYARICGSLIRRR